MESPDGWTSVRVPPRWLAAAALLGSVGLAGWAQAVPVDRPSPKTAGSVVRTTPRQTTGGSLDPRRPPLTPGGRRRQAGTGRVTAVDWRHGEARAALPLVARGGY